MSWRLAGSLKTLLAAVNRLYPLRSRASDGTIGDIAHQKAGTSDHLPNKRGIVTACDITHDPDHGCDAGILANFLRTSKSPRIKYVIWNRRMFSSYPAHGVPPWQWRPYTGPNPHVKHVHISVNDEMSDDYPWQIE